MATFALWNEWIDSPTLKISNDGKPLAVQTSDFLWWNFPYRRLSSQESVISFLLRPEGVVLMVLLYVVSKPVLTNLVRLKNIHNDTSKSPRIVFTRFVALHNLALSIFSLIVAIESWTILGLQMSRTSVKETYCDQTFLYGTSSFGSWALIFYISKFYEFADTWILILKGKQPSFLQLYHHVGIALSMWGGLVSYASWLVIVVCLNSVIHTLMYFYFFVKTLYPNVLLHKFAQSLTFLQIGQFVLGIAIQWSLTRSGNCDSTVPASNFMCVLIIAYAVGLIGLFLAFAFQKYYKKKRRHEEMKKKM